MTIEKIVEYVLHTPHNTNRAILIEMLEQLILENGGSLPGYPGSGGGGSGTPGGNIIYDGGIEK